MDNLETMGVFDSRNELLEEAAGLVFGHAAICHDVVEELSASIFENNDNISRC